MQKGDLHLLDSIKSPQQLHGLKPAQLTELAAQIRERIINTVVETGGHLGANLGVVELTIALHSVLNSPEDKIIWDVGHQCYAHKLLTGRNDSFSTLRQLGGISGFPRKCESVHDVFDVGHSSTSISVATGMAIARDLQNKDHKIVAVIGDGALTGGMAFEALNHAGQLGTDLIVILNDNAMSIAKNVGALSDYLNHLRMDPTLSKARFELENLIKRIPAIGGSMSKLTELMKDAVKSILPGQLFEQLGFSYFGPFDGHNIPLLQRAIRDGIHRGGPVLIHVLTQKGRGYAPAEANPSKFHGISPMNGDTEKHPDSLSYSEVFGNTLVKLAQEDSTIVAITAAMKDGTGLASFAKDFPDRFFDVGIAEQHGLTFAAGLANEGMKPVIALYSTFLQRGYDQVLHDICLQNLPVVIGIDRAGVVGDDGPTHQGVFDISFLRHIPNIVLLAPRNGQQLAAMLDWALKQNKPVAIRYPKAKTKLDTGELFNPDFTSSEILLSGSDCSILAVGNMVDKALAAAELLKNQVRCTVVDVRSIKPLDTETISRVARKTKNIVTVEDNVLSGGFGSSILEYFSGESGYKIVNMGYPDEFIPQGPIEYLQSLYGLSPEGIAAKVLEILGRPALKEIVHEQSTY